MAEVYCDMSPNGGCRLESRDSSGKPIHEMSAFGGGVPGAHWITLPCDSTIRLRVSPFATFTYDSKGDYSISGTFSSQPAKDPKDDRLDVWMGELKLPAVKIVPREIMTKLHLLALLVSAAISVAIGAAARAENIDFSTVPRRNTVQLTIYNSEDLTLVRETRKVTFKPGVNPLQFSWAGTLIDSTSVELRFLTHPDKLTVLDTTFPHDKPQMLYWNVESELDGKATVEITYFTSGIHWSADYVGIADADEKQLSLEGFVRVNNQSGEEYENAHVRLVVGRVNLVEKITQLAPSEVC